MKCLELTRNYYFDCVLHLMKKYFPSLAKNHSAALIGWGSEVLGNDDEFSRFYGWGPKPKIFLSNDDYVQDGENLREVFLKNLPFKYQGYPARFKIDREDGLPKPAEEDGFPLITISTFERLHKFYVGDISIPYSDFDWLLIPEQKLLELTSGEVFYDGLGILHGFREKINYFPDNVWKYRLAYQWSALDWDFDLIGLCNKRGDILSARLIINQTVKKIINLIFLLNRTYKPGYMKWIHKQFYKLPDLADQMGDELEKILITDDCNLAQSKINSCIERLVEFQVSKNIISKVDYKKSPRFNRGFHSLDLEAVILEIRKGISGELSELPFPLGAADQWITDEDLLQSPSIVKKLKAAYYAQEPERNNLGDKGL